MRLIDAPVLDDTNVCASSSSNSFTFSFSFSGQTFNTNNDFITCQTSISGCYAASNNLKGAIITREPLLRNRTVVLTIDKYTTSNQTFTNVHLVTGFSMYKVVLKKTIKDTYQTTIPYLSQDTFLIMSKTQKIWNILAFGKIRECSC